MITVAFYARKALVRLRSKAARTRIVAAGAARAVLIGLLWTELETLERSFQIGGIFEENPSELAAIGTEKPFFINQKRRIAGVCAYSIHSVSVKSVSETLLEVLETKVRCSRNELGTNALFASDL